VIAGGITSGVDLNALHQHRWRALMPALPPI
jgi:hypothetical protein